MPTIYLGSDHAGFKLKEAIKKYLAHNKFPHEDLGNFVFEETDDYPDYGHKVATAVAQHKKSLGILICGSSIGVCIVANKTRGVRAAPVGTTRDARLAKEHTNANIICLSGWNLSATNAKKIVRTWLESRFLQAARHRRRVAKITAIEKEEFTGA